MTRSVSCSHRGASIFEVLVGAGLAVVIVAAAVRIWNEWQAEQRSTAAKLIAAAETQKKAANAMLKRLAA